MSKVYVVMAYTNHVSAFNIPSPVAVFGKRRAAEFFAEEKNKKATRLTYYIRSADCTGILTGNADLELSDLERIEGICALSKEIRYE